MMFLLRCPKCRNTMKYETRSAILGSRRKTCVYCGRSFIAKDNILKRLA